MRTYQKLVLASGVVLGSLIGLSTASPAAKAGSIDSAAVMKAGDCCPTYFCQKCYNGCWHTVYVCYDYNQAMAWYDAQGPGARVVASK